MPVIPLALPWEPDKGSLSTTSLDYVMNVMPLPEGWGPISSLTAYSQALPSACKGAWWFRSDDGVFNMVAATQTGLFKLDNGTLPAWINISKVGGYVGPGDGELWTAAIFGTKFYVTNVNDPLQVISMASLTIFANAPGSPPQSKYIATIGDFLFLAHLQAQPRKWQHSKINDPTNWVIDGGPGSSDDQEIPDGDEIVGIVPMAGANARVIQKRARRGLSFTPGGITSFQQYDIDASRGAVAPHSIVSLGSNDYFYLTENGFVMNDEYKSIGAERIDNTFLHGTPHVNSARLFAVRATADPTRKIVWIVYEDITGTRRVIGYNWFLDRWFQNDENASIFVATATAGYVLDDLPLTLDDYPSPPMDSMFWMGGTFDFGAFKDDGVLYVFAGDKASATIDTSTMQLADGMGAYVWGAETNWQFDILHNAAWNGIPAQ